jgi:hypothetical protein
MSLVSPATIRLEDTESEQQLWAGTGGSAFHQPRSDLRILKDRQAAGVSLNDSCFTSHDPT